MITRTRWALGIVVVAFAIGAVTYGTWRLETYLRGDDEARVERPLLSVPERRL